MPESSWWTVSDTLMRIITGPYLWDGETPLTLPSGQRAVNTDPTTMGYSAASSGMDMTTVASRLAALEARLTAEARGVAPLPAIALLQTLTVRVTLKTQMPSTNYTPSALLVGTPVVGNLTVMSTTVVDRQKVDVAVRATVAISLGSASVLVFADAN